MGADGGAGKATEELADVCFVLIRQDEAVTVFEAEVDGVARVEFGLGDFDAIVADAVEAFEVFNEEAGGRVYDLSVAPGDAAIAQNELIVRLAADGEGERIEGDAGGVARRVDDGEFQSQGTILRNVVYCAVAAFSFWFSRRVWQWEQ